MKWVRRTHMYTGLILLPWVVLFGASGILFNHPSWLTPTQTVASEVAVSSVEGTALNYPSPVVLAAELVDQLNSNEGGHSGGPVYSLEPGTRARYSGRLYYSAKGNDEEHWLKVNVNAGTATIETRPESVAVSDSVERPPFSGTILDMDCPKPAGGIEMAESLFANVGIEPAEEVRLRSRSGPQLWFQVRDQDRRLWNVTYDLAEGRIDGRAEDTPAPMSVRSIMTLLHRIHVYPDSVSGRWMWSLAADATGLMMVFWGVSGLIMWWQIKPTRLLGVAGLSVAAVLAFVITSGALDELRFGPPRSRGESSRSATSPKAPKKAADQLGPSIEPLKKKTTRYPVRQRVGSE